MSISKPQSFIGEFSDIKLLNGRILVTDEDTAGDHYTFSGLILPKPIGSVMFKPVIATVLATAEYSLAWWMPPNKRYKIPFEVKAGDRVLIDRRHGERIIIKNRPCRLITENQVLAIIEGTEDEIAKLRITA